jgi:hypothetical protein
MFDEELVAAIEKHLAHEALARSRRNAFYIVGTDREIAAKSVPQYAGGIEPERKGALWAS